MACKKHNTNAPLFQPVSNIQVQQSSPLAPRHYLQNHQRPLFYVFGLLCVSWFQILVGEMLRPWPFWKLHWQLVRPPIYVSFQLVVFLLQLFLIRLLVYGDRGIFLNDVAPLPKMINLINLRNLFLTLYISRHKICNQFQRNEIYS